MGWPVYVYVWGQHKGPDYGYSDKEAYAGLSLFKAWLVMRKAKRDGFKCIRLEWRP